MKQAKTLNTVNQVGQIITKNRMFYLDNIRILLTVLVILHHIAIAYGGAGAWPVKETPTDAISPFLFFMFNVVNQTFFMSFFFLLSGYFVPLSFEKKGVIKFVLDKLLRLGLPLLFGVFLLGPFTSYLILNLVRGKTISLFDVIKYRIIHLDFHPGHLWFVFALLLYTVIYVLFRLVSDRRKQKNLSGTAKAFPNKMNIAVLILVMTLGTFAVRIFYPVGKELLYLQLGHHFHYIVCFFLGILAYRNKWFDCLTKKESKLWIIVSIVSILFFPVMLGVSGAAKVGHEVFMGGLHWQAFELSLWDSIACISIIISLSYIFKFNFNKQNTFFKSLSSNVYAVYIIHSIVIVVLNIVFRDIAIPTALKFFIVSCSAIPLCFFIAHLIRKVPYVNRIV